MAAYPTPGRVHNRCGRMVLLALLASAPAGAQYEGSGPERAATFDTAAHPEYGDPREGLRAMMREHRTHRAGPQHFCVVGYRYRDGGRNAHILWREGRRQILWEGWRDPLDRVGSITRSRRNLDLDTDVAPDGTFNSSTYMIFAREARDIAADCARAGRQYVLRR